MSWLSKHCCEKVFQVPVSVISPNLEAQALAIAKFRLFDGV
jgi:hypothetical protein